MVKDKLFLLSEEELRSYLSDKDRICQYDSMPCLWWLRSLGDYAHGTAYVDYYGSLYYYGYSVSSSSSLAVRTALHLNPIYLQSLKRIGEGYVIFAGREWLVLDETTGLLLAKNAVCLQRFDENSNKYEDSEIREYLNNKLLNDLFTAEEQQMIVDTVIYGETSYPAA